MARKTLAVATLGARRTLGRLRVGRPRQVRLGVAGVALAVALLVTVGGVAFGLAAGATVHGDGVDYWVVPEGQSASSLAVPVGGTQLGATHEAATRLAGDDRVEYVTPVLLRVARVRNQAAGSEEFVLLVGVVPPSESRRVAGLPTGPLAPGDPYYADGGYDGPWTGEAVLSDAAADLLAADRGDALAVGGRGGDDTRTFAVRAVAPGSTGSGVATLPVALVHLAELQRVSGATEADAADQLLVSTNSPAVRSRLEGLYPRTTVVSRSGLSGASASTASLPLAVAVAAVVAAVAVGVLFVTTVMGLVVTADRRTLATLAALGYATRSRSTLVLAETVTVSLLGGVAGVTLGGAGVVATNALSAAYLGVDDVARFHPLLVAAGLLVALCIGLLSGLYPVWLSHRTAVLEVLRE